MVLIENVKHTYVEGVSMGEKMNQEQIMQLLDKLYDQSVQGIAKVSPPIDELTDRIVYLITA